MEAATDTTNAPEAASTSKDARTQEAYRQEAGTILLAATPIGDVRDASPKTRAARSPWPHAWASSWAAD